MLSTSKMYFQNYKLLWDHVKNKFFNVYVLPWSRWHVFSSEVQWTDVEGIQRNRNPDIIFHIIPVPVVILHSYQALQVSYCCHET